MEKEQQFNPEDEAGLSGQPDSEGGREEAPEKLPDDNEMWSVAGGLDQKARELVTSDSEAFHESVVDVAFGDSADLATNVASVAAVEMQPFLEAFRKAMQEAPNTGRIARGREAADKALGGRGGRTV